MPAPEAALDHYDSRKQLAVQAAAHAAAQWAKVDRDDIGRSWLRLLPGLAGVLSAAQLAAASDADPYMGRVAPASTVDGLVQAAAFAGAAADGRSLAGLLFHPVMMTLKAIGSGASVDRAMAVGAANLDMIVRSEVADAGRVADQVAMVGRPEVPGYTRVVVGKTCAKCIILAGRWYRVSEGFARHPRCDCIMLPTSQAEAVGLVQDPMAIYESMTERERTEAGWSEADQKAIDAGADINLVTNAQRSVYTAGGREFTRDSTTKRGVTRGKLNARMTPDQIFIEAGDDRDQAIELLRKHGYLTGDVKPVKKDDSDQQGDLPVAVSFNAKGEAIGADGERIKGAYRTLPVAIRDEAVQLADLAQSGVGFSTVRREAHGALDRITQIAPEFADRGQELRDEIESGASPEDIVEMLYEFADEVEEQAPAPSGARSSAQFGRGRSSAKFEEIVDDIDSPDQRLLDALVPRAERVTAARLQQIESVLSDRLDGSYAGFDVQVSEVVASEDAIHMTALIFKDGRMVGRTERQFQRTNGELSVHHALLELSSNAQGQGFAEAWNGHLMDWYSQSGVETIRVGANIDVGGYAWARQGFDFASASDADGIARRLEWRLREHATMYDTAQIADLKSMIKRLRAGEFGSDQYPTAYEVSQAGRKPGQGKDDRWPGKDAMLGSSWSGVKPVPKQPSPSLHAAKAAPGGPDRKTSSTLSAGIRPALESARTTMQVREAFEAEAQRITGRRIWSVFSGSSATAREHSEGILRGLERFPRANLRGVTMLHGGESGTYAVAGGQTIRFSSAFSSAAGRRGYLNSLRRGTAGWDEPRPEYGETVPGTGFHVRGAESPMSVAIHEFGHILDIDTLAKRIESDVNALVAKRVALATAENAERRTALGLEPFAVPSSHVIRNEVSEYAMKNNHELVAEAFTDVMLNGDSASVLSRGIYDLLVAEYERTFG